MNEMKDIRQMIGYNNGRNSNLSYDKWQRKGKILLTNMFSRARLANQQLRKTGMKR